MRRIVCVAMVCALAACAPSLEDLNHRAATLAATAGMHPVQGQGGPFVFQLFERITDASAPVRIYIEGDGNAWLTRTQVSPDPTPRDPVGLQLAVRDTTPNVVYMARVCQYVSSRVCEPKYWTSAQFGDEVIMSVNSVLSRWPGHKFELVGYSGGAAVALLVAQRRDDVISIRTVAGNIDTDAFIGLHHLSPLAESMNPVNNVAKIAMSPQMHFSGARDKVVPPSISAGHRAHLPSTNCSAYHVVDAVDHYSGWVEQWPQLLTEKLPCTN